MHNLNVVNDEVALAYTGTVPWHGLGTYVNKPMTVEEALNLGKLDWNVAMFDLHADVQGEIVPVPTNMKRAVVREDTNQVIGVVGSKYQVVSNKDAFSFFDHIVEKQEAFIHTVGALGRGEKVWVIAKLPKDIVVKDRDVSQCYLLLTTSHDGSCTVKGKFTPVRVVCQNTLSGALMGGSEFSITHTYNAMNRLKKAHELMGIVAKTYEETVKVYNRMADYAVNPNIVDGFINKLLPLNADATYQTRRLNSVNEIMHRFKAGKGNEGKTLWDLYNGVTEYVDWAKTVRKGANRWEATTFKSGSKLKDRALELATALVN